MHYLRFEWPRWPGMLTIKTSRREDRLNRVPAGIQTISWDAQDEPEFYEPMKIPELVFEFAKVETADQALAFANEYGPLGFVPVLAHVGMNFKKWGVPSWVDPALFEKFSDLGPDLLAEPLRDWLGEASGLRFALQAWDALEARDYAVIRRILPSLRRQPFPHIKEWFVNFVNFHLVSGTETFLCLDSHGHPEPHTTPINLKTALWLQVSQIMTGITEIRPCAICGEMMDVTGNTRRKRVHAACSLRERMKRYRSKL